MRTIVRRLLWVDTCAAAAAGALVLAAELAFNQWLSSLYRLPHALLVFIGVANLVYACFSSSLAKRRSRTLRSVEALVAANLAWAGACIAMAWQWAGTASVFGQFHLLGEAAFVAGLAACEWRCRHLLSARIDSAGAGP